MRWVVIGANGYVGQFVLQRLVKEGVGEIVATMRKSVPPPPPFPPPSPILSYTNLDIEDEEKVEEVVEGADIVVNCAAVARVSEAKGCEGVNIPSVLILAVKKQPRCILVHFSTDLVYRGGEEGGGEGGEEGGVVLEPRTAYGVQKAKADALIHTNLGSRGRVLRCSNIIGPPAPFTSAPKFLDWVKQNAERNVDDAEKRATVWSDEKRCFVHIEDVVEGVLRIVDDDECCLVDAIGPELLSRAEFVERFCERHEIPFSSQFHPTPRPSHASSPPLVVRPHSAKFEKLLGHPPRDVFDSKA